MKAETDTLGQSRASMYARVRVCISTVSAVLRIARAQAEPVQDMA